MPAAVALVDVDKSFGQEAIAVDHVNLTVAQGEYVSIIGPSGCGKTTTLRMVAGFEDPTAGRIEIGGRDCTRIEPHKRNTAMVFQHFALFPHMTVAGNVAFGLEMRRIPANERSKRVMEMLRAVGIEQLASRPVTQLSGGQQQRVGLARALVTQPDILLLDEPLGSLDANLRERMIRVLRKLNVDLGVAFMHVTHSQAEAFAVSDRVVVMNHGRIEQIGPPETIAYSPRNLFVAQFVGKNNIVSAEMVGQSEGVATVATPLGRFLARTTDTTLADKRRCHMACPARRIRILRDGDTADNQLDGRLAFMMFETSHLELNVQVGPEVVFRIDHFEPGSELASLRVGTPVRLGWSANDAFLIQD
jgi:ABC-type Fe3+/spermidine/putrescine transport system ATPase subunit